MNRKKTEIIVNGLIVVLVITGLIIMFNFNDEDNELVSHGIANFKYYTVLSNVFCGIIAFSQFSFDVLSALSSREFKDMGTRFKNVKLISTTAVGLTFSMVAFFLWPIYKLPGMYSGSNLFFHLFVPILAIIDFFLLGDGEKIPFKYTVYAAVLTVFYGSFYLVNILINGVGEWPDTNDWYGYLNWGFPIGILIFIVTTIVTWALACLLRWISNIINSKK